MRPIYKIKEERKVSPEMMDEIKNDIETTIDHFARYLEDFQGEGNTKTQVVGPVGKLLSGISSAKFETRDALVGYVVNIHKNTTKSKTEWLSDEGRENLEKGIETLLSLKEKAPNRLFSKALREIDYGVYKRKLEYIYSKNKKKDKKAKED